MYQVLISKSHIGLANQGSVIFLQKEKIKDSIFIEQQKKYHEIVNNLNSK